MHNISQKQVRMYCSIIKVKSVVAKAQTERDMKQTLLTEFNSSDFATKRFETKRIIICPIFSKIAITLWDELNILAKRKGIARNGAEKTANNG